METIGEAARRLLQGLERAAKVGNEAPGCLQRPGEIEKPTGNAGDAQPVGNTRAEGGEPHGLEKLASGVAGIERFPGFREGHMRPLATDADSNATEFTVLLRGSNAHRVIGCNDNRAHAADTFWRWS